MNDFTRKHPSGRTCTPINPNLVKAVLVPRDGTFDHHAAACAFRDAKARQAIDQGCAFIDRARIDRLIRSAQDAPSLDQLVARALGPTRAAIRRHALRQA